MREEAERSSEYVEHSRDDNDVRCPGPRSRLDHCTALYLVMTRNKCNPMCAWDEGEAPACLPAAGDVPYSDVSPCWVTLGTDWTGEDQVG